MTMGCVKKIFLRVCGMCLSQVWYYLSGYCVLYGTWVLDGVMTKSFALPIDLFKAFWKSQNG